MLPDVALPQDDTWWASLDRWLRLCSQSLRLHTSALYWYNEADDTFCLCSVASDSEQLKKDPMCGSAGFFAALKKSTQPVHLALDEGERAPIYRHGAGIRHLLAMPVFIEERCVAALVLDRMSDQDFGAADLAIAQDVAAEVARIAGLEGAVRQLKRERYWMDKIHQTRAVVSEASSLEAIAQELAQSLGSLLPSGFSLVALLEEASPELEKSKTRQEGFQDDAAAESQAMFEVCGFVGASRWQHLAKARFGQADTLVGAALKAKSPLPHGITTRIHGVAMAQDLDRDLSDIKIWPLVWQGRALGAMVVGAFKQPLSKERLDVAQTLCSNTSAALANAQMVSRLERMATTDGLTGLINHREFQIRFDAAMARALRHERSLAVILTDIDHFKKVNDVFGHPAGDHVLRRVAEILAGSARCIDVVARYGGEEFALLMEDTDDEGAWRMAERIRTAVEDECFSVAGSTLHATLSLGIATYPKQGPNKGQLTHCADQALYQAKRDGRNRTIVFGREEEQLP